MSLYIMLCACFLLSLWIHTSSSEEINPDSLPFYAKLNKKYDLRWNLNATHIVFETQVETNGYVGFGISRDYGLMVPGDVIIGWVKDGQTHFADRYASQYAMPTRDKSQDWTLLKGTESGSLTTLTMIRKLVTGDREDLPITTGTSTYVIYCYNDLDPVSDDMIPYHGVENRGSKVIAFNAL